MKIFEYMIWSAEEVEETIPEGMHVLVCAGSVFFTKIPSLGLQGWEIIVLDEGYGLLKRELSPMKDKSPSIEV